MHMKDKQEYLNEVYRKALGAGLCGSKKEFAELLRVNLTGLYAAMNGDKKNLTDSLVRKVQIFAQQNGLEGSDKKPETSEQKDGVYIPKETMDMYTSMAKALENMSAIIRGVNEVPPLPTEKNFQTKR